MKRFRQGQSTLEYVIILAAVVGAIIAVGLMIKTNLGSSYGKLGTKMDAKVGEVQF